ncbi:transposase [Pseudomonas silensiensis]
MKRFIEGEARTQVTLLPEYLDDYVAEENPVRVVDVFVDELDLGALGFEGVDPAATGRPAYHPAVLLKIYIYGYLNRIQSSRRQTLRMALPLSLRKSAMFLKSGKKDPQAGLKSSSISHMKLFQLLTLQMPPVAHLYA